MDRRQTRNSRKDQQKAIIEKHKFLARFQKLSSISFDVFGGYGIIYLLGKETVEPKGP